MARRKRDEKTKDLFAYAEDNLQPAIVYIAVNKINGKRYVGLTRRTIDIRRRQHAAQAKHKPGGMIFMHAIRKYGIETFDFSEVVVCGTYREACAEEQRLIALLKPEYNISKGGQGPIGVRRDQKHCERMRNMNRNRVHPNKGKKLRPETIEKMRAFKLANPVRPWLGKKRDAATVAKMRATKIGVCTPKMWRALQARCKWVVCLNDGCRFKGIGEAGRAYGLVPRSVAEVCRGKTQSLHGYRFRYEEAAP